MASNCYIYALVDPRDNTIRYVGKTVHGLIRYSNHMSKSQLKLKTKKNHWIKKLISQNLKPILEILEFGKPEELPELEIFYINYFRFLGMNLCNLTDGGEGCLGRSPSDHNMKVLSKPIIDLNTGEIYLSVRAFRRKNNTSAGPTHLCLEGKVPQVKGFYIAWLDNNQNTPEWRETKLAEMKSAHNLRKQKPHQWKSVKCLNNNITYSSIKEASGDLGVTRSQITGVAKGKHSHCRGYRFIYV